MNTKKDASAAAVPKSDGQKVTPKSIPKVDDFPSLIGSSTSTNHISPTNWGAAPTKVAPKPKEIKRQPTADDFPALVPATSTTSTSQRILPEPLLPSYVPSTSKQAAKTKDKKAKSKVVEPPLPPAPDLEPFSSALLKAKKSSWWNSADNDVSCICVLQKLFDVWLISTNLSALLWAAINLIPTYISNVSSIKV